MENNVFKELTLPNNQTEEEKIAPEIDGMLNIQDDDNFQQKSSLRNSQIEKKLVKNTEISKNKESEPSRVEIISLEIDGQTLEAEKYYFEYPERIKKEAGILGYERTKISNDSIFNFYRQFCKTQYDFDFEKYNINNELDLVSYPKNILKKEKESGFGIIQLMNYKILMSLSEGEYPRYTHNHKMGAYTNNDRAARMEENFRDDKFFVQKIYDTNRINKLTKKEDGGVADGRLLFNFPEDGDWRFPRSNITLFNKQNGERLSDRMLHVGKLAEYEEQINSNTVFGASVYGGFNVMASTFFLGSDLKKISVGFPMKLDPFHEEYLLKSLRAFEKIAIKNLLKEKDNKLLERMISYQGPIGQIVFMLFINKAMSDPLLFEELGSFNSNDKGSKNLEKMHKIFKQFVQNFPHIYNVNNDLEKYVVNVVDFNKGFFGFSGLERSFFENCVMAGSIIADKNETRINQNRDTAGEEYLPVFVNHDEIPQLAWGHAKYAHYSNKKNFNFFKFKHADHLPIKPNLEN